MSSNWCPQCHSDESEDDSVRTVSAGNAEYMDSASSSTSTTRPTSPTNQQEENGSQMCGSGRMEDDYQLIVDDRSKPKEQGAVNVERVVVGSDVSIDKKKNGETASFYVKIDHNVDYQKKIVSGE